MSFKHDNPGQLTFHLELTKFSFKALIFYISYFINILLETYRVGEMS